MPLINPCIHKLNRIFCKKKKVVRRNMVEQISSDINWIIILAYNNINYNNNNRHRQYLRLLSIHNTIVYWHNPKTYLTFCLAEYSVILGDTSDYGRKTGRKLKFSLTFIELVIKHRYKKFAPVSQLLPLLVCVFMCLEQ